MAKCVCNVVRKKIGLKHIVLVLIFVYARSLTNIEGKLEISQLAIKSMEYDFETLEKECQEELLLMQLTQP